jgi:hypothetical protein
MREFYVDYFSRQLSPGGDMSRLDTLASTPNKKEPKVLFGLPILSTFKKETRVS